MQTMPGVLNSGANSATTKDWLNASKHMNLTSFSPSFADSSLNLLAVPPSFAEHELEGGSATRNTGAPTEKRQ
jgi:hypothetical protein